MRRAKTKKNRKKKYLVKEFFFTNPKSTLKKRKGYANIMI